MPWPSLSPPGFTPAPRPKEATQTAYQLCRCNAADPDHQEGPATLQGPELAKAETRVTARPWVLRRPERAACRGSHRKPGAAGSGSGAPEQPSRTCRGRHLVGAERSRRPALARASVSGRLPRGAGGASAPPLTPQAWPGQAWTFPRTLAPGPGGGGRNSLLLQAPGPATLTRHSSGRGGGPFCWKGRLRRAWGGRGQSGPAGASLGGA